MKHEEHQAKSASSPIPRFLTALSNPLRARRTGVPSARRVPICIALCGTLAALALATVAPSVAAAAQLHAFSTIFASPGSGAGQLSLATPEIGPSPGSRLEAPGSGLAVDAQTGDLYVADTADHRVAEFGPTGAFVRAFGWEVNAEHPEAILQQCTLASGCQVGSVGEEPGQFETPVFVAVDNSCALHEPPLTEATTPTCHQFDPSAGDLYVADVGDNLVTKFDPAGGLVESWGNNGAGATPNGQLNGSPTQLFNGGFSNVIVSGIAVDRSGHLSVLGVGGKFFRFDQEGEAPETHATGRAEHPAGIAVDHGARLYFSGNFEAIERFNPGTATTESLFGGGSGGNIVPTSLALNPNTSELYIDEEGASLGAISPQCEPSTAGCQPFQKFGSGHLSEAAGLAAAPDGTIYVADAGASRIAIFGVSLEANTDPASQVEATSALIEGSVNPKGGEVTTCEVQIGASTSYGRNVPCLDGADEEIGTADHPITGNAPVVVHARLARLKGGTTYHYRLRAVKEGSGELGSEDRELETLVLPLIENAEATEVTATSAMLRAAINPQGPPVSSCQIEWGTSTAYGNVVPCEPASLPAGASSAPVSASLLELNPATTYHWRIAASDENGTETSVDHTFVFLPGPSSAEVDQECTNEPLREANGSTGLPDCRAYEQVTPARKNGALIGEPFLGAKEAIAADGSRLLAGSLQCFASSLSCNALRTLNGAAFELGRTASGWAAESMTLPASLVSGSTLWNVNADQGTAIYSGTTPSVRTPGPSAFFGRSPGGVVRSIGPVAERSEFGVEEEMSNAPPVIATADLSHVVYEPQVRAGVFWPMIDQTSEGRSLYEYAGPANHPILVPVTGGVGSTELIGTCGGALGNFANSPPAAASSLSSDGHTIYFTVGKCATGTGSHAGVEVPAQTIYARIDGEGSTARTVKISGPAPEPECNPTCQAQPPANAAFAGASADGSAAYFLSTAQLTSEASEDSEPGDQPGSCPQTIGRGGCNLYLYRDPQQQPLVGDHLVDVSAGDTSGLGPEVQGVVAISPDGSHCYFVAKGLLAGANAEGAEPVEGGENLYVYDSVAEQVHFVASLSATSGSENYADGGQWKEGIGDANVTPDGRYLLFTSSAPLTNDGRGEVGPAQVYRYDAQAEVLTRVSIGREGFNDNGNLGLGNARIVAAARSIGEGRANPSISADGKRAFFESPIALTPGALNDVVVNERGWLAQNVYEWEENGAGACEQAAGCIYLISDGRDDHQGATTGVGKRNQSAVELIGADSSGQNVFFTTVDPLVPGDGDTESDIYDARVGGGFPGPSSSAPCESSEACHGAGGGEAQGELPASNSFSGQEEGPNHPRHSKHRHKRHRRHKHHKRTHGKHQRAGQSTRRKARS